MSYRRIAVSPYHKAKANVNYLVSIYILLYINYN
jgi:hypothetical protein